EARGARGGLSRWLRAPRPRFGDQVLVRLHARDDRARRATWTCHRQSTRRLRRSDAFLLLLAAQMRAKIPPLPTSAYSRTAISTASARQAMSAGQGAQRPVRDALGAAARHPPRLSASSAPHPAARRGLAAGLLWIACPPGYRRPGIRITFSGCILLGGHTA